MRIYNDAYSLISETSRNLMEMGKSNSPKTYQNKLIDNNPNFETKELISEQYCLLNLPDPETLFIFTKSKEWAEKEFQERIGYRGCIENPGEAWKLRKDVWEDFINPAGNFDYTYSERMLKKLGPITSLEAVIHQLIRDNDTRKAILPIYDIEDNSNLDGSLRIPCSMYYNFLIRYNTKGEKQLNICYHQRSSDFVTHFGNDVYLAWLLMLYISDKVRVKPGYLYHTIDSLHVYRKDFERLRLGISFVEKP